MPRSLNDPDIQWVVSGDFGNPPPGYRYDISTDSYVPLPGYSQNQHNAPNTYYGLGALGGSHHPVQQQASVQQAELANARPYGPNVTIRQGGSTLTPDMQRAYNQMQQLRYQEQMLQMQQRVEDRIFQAIPDITFDNHLGGRVRSRVRNVHRPTVTALPFPKDDYPKS